ncbi:hypothetical protein QFZ75_006415 [Streptomyces sp. V3I8]|nr:hypothetical protein [Streptomyces sp. V3I8]
MLREQVDQRLRGEQRGDRTEQRDHQRVGLR